MQRSSSNAQKVQRKTTSGLPQAAQRQLKTVEFPRNGTTDNIGPKALEEQKGCSAEQFRDAILNSLLSVAVIDRNGTFVHVNPALCWLTQYSEKELLGRDSLSIVHPKDRANSAAAQRKLHGNVSGPLAVEIRLLTKQQSTVWVRSSASLVRDSFITLMEDIGEQKKAENAIRDLSTRLLRLQDEERRRIARDLHDHTGQNLSALLALLASVKQSGVDLDHTSRESLAEAIALAKQCAREVRNFSYLLHPPLLEHLDLHDALTGYVQGFRRRSGLDVQLQIAKDMRPLAKEIETTVYRLIQEGLNNILHHSGSARAEIQIEIRRDCLVLQIRDFGRGMALEKGANFPASRQLGVGILGMRERVEQFGGEFEIHSGNSGTEIRALLPLEECSA